MLFVLVFLRHLGLASVEETHRDFLMAALNVAPRARTLHAQLTGCDFVLHEQVETR
jgi:hypothetical protein